jgi:site-specific recombinase XerD
MTLSKKGLTMSTLSRRRATINEFGRWGARQRYWERSPVEDLPKIKKPPRPLPRPFTEEERDRLFALELSEDERVMRALLYFAGLRVSEVCGLHLGDITLGTLDEPGTLRPRGKGSKERVLPIAPGLFPILRDYVLARSSLNPRDFLLTQKDGTPWRRRSAERRTARWGTAARVHDCTPHRFRHTFATDLLRQGTDIRYIQALLGHARLDTTEIYTQVANPELVKAVNRLRITGPDSGPPRNVDNLLQPK